MTTIRKELVWDVYQKTFTLKDYNFNDTFENCHEFRKQNILTDESLTEDEKSEAIRLSTEALDYCKVFYTVIKEQKESVKFVKKNV
jgi:hypothetical protein